MSSGEVQAEDSQASHPTIFCVLGIEETFVTRVRRPATRPCYSCPYQKKVPSGIWSAEEYEKLPRFDGETFDQPFQVFMCHQQNGRLCAGWAGCHDMDESLGLRLLITRGRISEADYLATCNYVSPVELWSSGAEAAAHGLRDLDEPGGEARDAMKRLIARDARRKASQR